MDSEVTDLAGIKSVTISTLQAKPSEGAFADGDKTKLDGIEASADVTGIGVEPTLYRFAICCITILPPSRGCLL